MPKKIIVIGNQIKAVDSLDERTLFTKDEILQKIDLADLKTLDQIRQLLQLEQRKYEADELKEIKGAYQARITSIAQEDANNLDLSNLFLLIKLGNK